MSESGYNAHTLENVTREKNEKEGKGELQTRTPTRMPRMYPTYRASERYTTAKKDTCKSSLSKESVQSHSNQDISKKAGRDGEGYCPGDVGLFVDPIRYSAGTLGTRGEWAV